MTTLNTFKVNGVEFSQLPAEHGWVNQEVLGMTGDGHPIYPAFRSYEMSFDFSSAAEFSSFQTYFSSIGLTGTVSVDLPEYAAATYQFRTYSGTVINQPEFSGYFENYYQSAKLIINRIRTA